MPALYGKGGGIFNKSTSCYKFYIILVYNYEKNKKLAD